MKKSGLADSPFFSMQRTKRESHPGLPGKSATTEAEVISDEAQMEETAEEKPENRHTAKPQEDDATMPRYHDTMTPGNHETMMPGDQGEVIEFIRRELIRFGKEAATHRFTKREKRSIAEIIYVFKKRGLKTSENETARIAVNFIIIDYEKYGDDSILARVLKALNE